MGSNKLKNIGVSVSVSASINYISNIFIEKSYELL